MKRLTDHLQDFLEHKRSLNHSDHTLRAYRNNISRFVRWLHETHDVATPEQIRTDHLLDWHRYLGRLRTPKGLPLRPSSINKNIENTRQLIGYLVKKGLVNPRLSDALEYVREPELLPTSVLTHAQVKKLIGKIPLDSPVGYRDRTMVETIYSTGIRVAELLSLDIPHVDVRNATAIVMGKGSRQRVVPIGKTALKYLETYLKAIRPFLVQENTDQALFLNKDGKRVHYHMFLKIIHQYAKAAKLDINVTPHTFRRSCTTELFRSGANIYHVKELLGHRNLNTLHRYTKLTITDLKKTHEKCHPRERDHS